MRLSIKPFVLVVVVSSVVSVTTCAAFDHTLWLAGAGAASVLGMGFAIVMEWW